MTLAAMLRLACGLAVLLTTASAAPRGSPSYSATTEGLNGGGTASASADYTTSGTLGDIIGVANVPDTGTASSGFQSGLPQPQSLSVTATPPSVPEGLTSQLRGTAALDDGTFTALADRDITWSILTGAIASISRTGVATTGAVFVNAPASARGSWGGVQGDVTLTVLTTHLTPPATPVADTVFTSLNFAPSQAGLYQGLLMDSLGNVTGAITGVKLLSSGAFSGKVVFNGVTYALTGSVQADGSYAGTIARKGSTPLAVTLQLGKTSVGGLTLQGSVTGDGITSSGFIAQAPYGTGHAVPPAWVKSYTFLVPAVNPTTPGVPGGDGYGSAKVSTLGVVSAAGKTGDGVAFTHTGYLTADQQWHLFQPLYTGTGLLAGVLTFRDVPGVSDLDGSLRWVKNPNAKDKSYSAGFNLTPTLVGALYTPPVSGQRALSQLANQTYNAQLSLASPGLPNGGIARAVSWLSTNSILGYGPDTLSAAVTPATGLLSGKYVDPLSKLTVAFAGAVLQKQGLAGGDFLLNNLAGRLLIDPGIAFYYPGSEGAGPLSRLTVPDTSATPPTLASSRFTTAAAGKYGGILTNGTKVSGGLESIVVSTTGTLTGTVVIEGKRYAISGRLDVNGTAFISILRPGLSNLSGTLQLTLASGTTDGFQLTGTFVADGVTQHVDAQRYPVYTTKLPAPQTGRYTLAMRAPTSASVAVEPGGDGYASLIVSYTGAATGTLVLADGTAVTFAGNLSRSGEWSVHRNVYGTGYVAGKLSFRDLAGISDADGQWRWVKPAGVARTTSYPAGFDVTRGVIASRYTAPAAGTRALALLANASYNAWLRISGPDLSTLPALTLNSLDRAITWTAANQLLYYGPEKTALTFVPATGLLGGTYVDSANGVSLTLGGALLQKQNLVTGRCSASGQSGLVVIEKRQ